jgi:hypothetical protein
MGFPDHAHWLERIGQRKVAHAGALERFEPLPDLARNPPRGMAGITWFWLTLWHEPTSRLRAGEPGVRALDWD